MKSENHHGICCGLCSEIFPNKLKLAGHRSIVHLGKSTHSSEKKFCCVECGKVFSYNSSLYYHIKDLHSDIKNWNCDKCGNVYKSKHKLDRHIKRIHEKMPCSICGKLFSTENNGLKNHMITVHTDNHLKPHICKIETCKKGFNSARRLSMHMNTHTGNKPYPCKYCGKAFADERNKRTHEKSHEGIKRQKKICSGYKSSVCTHKPVIPLTTHTLPCTRCLGLAVTKCVLVMVGHSVDRYLDIPLRSG